MRTNKTPDTPTGEFSLPKASVSSRQMGERIPADFLAGRNRTVPRRPVAFGIAAGGAGTLALVRLLARLLDGAGPADAATYSSAGMVVLAVAAVSCWLPSGRAMRVDRPKPCIANNHLSGGCPGSRLRVQVTL